MATAIVVMAVAATGRPVAAAVAGGTIINSAGDPGGLAANTGEIGPATSATFTNTWSVATDGAGNVYVLDWANNRVGRVDSAGVINDFAGDPAGAFGSAGAYAVYTWELFFHAPLPVAHSLSQSQRFEDALRWFHFIFDPTSSSGEPLPARYWKVCPSSPRSRSGSPTC